MQDQVKLLIREIKNSDLYFVIVTNEVGMSIVADNRLSRIYTDILGRINQLIAKESDTVYLLVSGIPVKIKG
ncbi:bifunctional adenosylcobinamide kinase/adenosylcobinamide-phosphate guanylyltransferase [Alkalithermobacter thermoalcaliphilus]|uniref:bifunctional adenosylcobinamide kinase/adenosylcobinamide-phosphate guanylyltransferase n=1 Tax=Clostridium paradoxum TaxID=29346 RepID=UPI002F90FF5D